jgi:glycosyltransferase 2 family protein
MPEGKSPRSKLFKRLGTLASILIFALSLAVLYFIISELEASEVSAAFSRVDWRQIGLALFFTTLSYLLLTGYDWVALKQVTTRLIPYRISALAGFTSYAISFTLGFPLLTAATVRYWIYSSVGLPANAIASLTLIAGITFWLGMVLVLGSVALIAPAATAIFTRLPLSFNLGLGLLLFSGIGAYLVYVWRGARGFSVQGWALKFPDIETTLKQMLLGAADVCAGAAVLFVLLPAGVDIPFATILAAYVFACFLGIISHAPGGIGVFEATMLLVLPGIPRETLLGVLLVYRLIYYLVPFILALSLLGTREIMLRAGILQRHLAQSHDSGLNDGDSR